MYLEHLDHENYNEHVLHAHFIIRAKQRIKLDVKEKKKNRLCAILYCIVDLGHPYPKVKTNIFVQHFNHNRTNSLHTSKCTIGSTLYTLVCRENSFHR